MLQDRFAQSRTGPERLDGKLTDATFIPTWPKRSAHRATRANAILDLNR
jgi:hypothetical protein